MNEQPSTSTLNFGEKKNPNPEKVAQKVLAPFLRRLKRQGTQDLRWKFEDPRKKFFRSKIKEVITKLTSFCADSLEVPTVLNETAEILKEVTKSSGVSSYMVDETSTHITLNPKYMPKSERCRVKYKIEAGKTVAAFVAYTQEFVVVDDVLGDARFPLGIPGSKKNIKAVLCVPVLTTVDGKCIAVVELYKDIEQEPYTALDLQICVSMTGWMGAAIHQNNERIFLLKKTELNNYLASLVEFFFAGALSFDKFVSDVIECAKVSVQAERGSFYAMDEEIAENTEDEIVADIYEEGIDTHHHILRKRNKQKFTKNSSGFAGQAALRGRTLNVHEAYKDPLSSRERPCGLILKSVISVPLKGTEGVLGVLQLVNKMEEPHFNSKDEILLQNIAGYAYLACKHRHLKEQLKLSFYKQLGWTELLETQMKPGAEELKLFRDSAPTRKSDLPTRFFRFDWVITGSESKAAGYAVFMFTHLLGDLYFDRYTLTEFILTVKRLYRKNPYHNFFHAFTVCHCLYNIVLRNKESFTPLQTFALLIGTLCHDIDHVGYTNNFLEMTNHWLAELYWESPLEHHHYDVCVLAMEATGLLSRLGPHDTAEMKKLLKVLILATDLVQHFRTRNQMITLLKNKTFDWGNKEHLYMFLGMVMTVCDVSGQCKPFYTAKRVTEGLYMEFYNQGDLEKKLGFSPLAMMDREKTSSIPENQIQFLSLICIPSVEILVRVFPNTEDLLVQCVELKECWSDIQAKKVVEVWKLSESILN